MSALDWIALLGLTGLNGCFVWWATHVAAESLQRLLAVEKSLYAAIDRLSKDKEGGA